MPTAPQNLLTMLPVDVGQLSQPALGSAGLLAWSCFHTHSPAAEQVGSQPAVRGMSGNSYN